MKQEDAKAWLPIVQAMATGQNVECASIQPNMWVPVQAVDTVKFGPEVYRVAPNRLDYMSLHKKCRLMAGDYVLVKDCTELTEEELQDRTYWPTQVVPNSDVLLQIVDDAGNAGFGVENVFGKRQPRVYLPCYLLKKAEEHLAIYRPFRHSGEFTRKRNKWLVCRDSSGKQKKVRASAYSLNGVVLEGKEISYEDLFRLYQYENGEPCGKQQRW